MDLWERQRDENGKLEPIKAFEYFNEYLTMDKPRSLRRLIKQLNKKPTFLSQLGRYSSTWNWVERAEAYDEFICAKKRATKEKFYEELIESELPRLIKQLGIVDSNIDDLSDDFGARPSSTSKGLEQASRAKKNLLEMFLTLAGKPKEYTANDVMLDSTVNASVDVSVLESEARSTDEVIGIVDDELESIYADRETESDETG